MSQQTNSRREEIIEMLQVCDEQAEACTPRRFNDIDDTCSASEVLREFGTWTDAKAAANLHTDINVNLSERYADEDILMELRECARRNNGDCTVETLEQESDLIDPSVVIDRMDSWDEAKQSAGLAESSDASPTREYTSEKFLQLLRESKEKHGDVTRMTDRD